MLTNFGYIGMYLVAAILFTLLMLTIPILLKLIKIVPHNPSSSKSSTFECGVETIGKTYVRFNFRYYYYALVFLALDVLVVFIYPWAVGLKQLGFAGLIGILTLVSIVVVGYLYAWRKKVLEWK
ncbi:MAG: NADH-quinone oxidoreductase subunit A [Dehalococcoidales bacterium]|nr:NADH-quinone oxidoreductase subunit A [Dehalococcoidales bacterium]